MSKQFKGDLNAFFTVFKQLVVAILSARAGIYIKQDPPKKRISTCRNINWHGSASLCLN